MTGTIQITKKIKIEISFIMVKNVLSQSEHNPTHVREE